MSNTTNIQFNSKDAKNFRTICEKYYNAQHTMVDVINKKNDIISGRQTIIDDNTADLQAIADGTYKGHRTKAELEAENASCVVVIATAKADYEAAKDEQEKRIAEGIALYTKNMHEAAKSVITSWGSTEAYATWRTALAESLVSAGVKDATPENVARFDFTIGVKKNGAKAAYKNGTLIGSMAYKPASVLFMDTLVEYLASDEVKAIKPFAHKYIPVSERKNKK